MIRQNAHFQDKLLQKAEKEREALENEQKRMAILDDLRAQVAPEVDIDPARVISNTENWRNRNKETETKIDLFRFNSYSDRQLLGDGRLKFEMMLRAANIPINDYAIKQLSQFQPATAPRRDTRHTDLFR